MAEERTRIDFNAPVSLVERADALAEILDTSRTRILIDALRDELDELATEEGVRDSIRAAYYDERVDFETVETILGTEEAFRLKLLRSSIDREPPEPTLSEPPSDSPFYDGEIPEWSGDEESDDVESSV